jgi:hypothetical protein
MGTTFVFGSWICEANGEGKIQSRLAEQTRFDDIKIDDMEELQLAEKLMTLSTSSPIQEEVHKPDSEKYLKTISDYNTFKGSNRWQEKENFETDSEEELKSVFYTSMDPTHDQKEGDHETNSEENFNTISNLKTFIKIPSSLPYGLHNSASIVQEYLKKPRGCRGCPYHRVGRKNSLAEPTTLVHNYQGQQGKMKQIMKNYEPTWRPNKSSIDPKDYMMRLPGSFSEQPNYYIKELPFQEGRELASLSYDAVNSEEEKPVRRLKKLRRRTIYMANVAELPASPKTPEVCSLDESEDNISEDERTEEEEESKEQR